MQQLFWSFICSVAFTVLIGKKFISCLRKFQKHGQPIRDDGPETHAIKAGTPTMGGLIIITTFTIGTILFADLTSKVVHIIGIVLFSYGVIGFIDDYAKITKRSTKGLTVKMRFTIECVIAFAVVLFINRYINPITELNIPFIDHAINIGPLYYLIASVAIVGTSNAVNLTDGLDGLVSGSIIMVMICFCIAGYMVVSGTYLNGKYGPINTPEDILQIMILCGIIIGSVFGFLWYNAYPAQVFMGDVGSLGIGAVIGTIAVIMRQELTLVITGGIFVVEALSVIIQVFSYKTRRKRVFLMAPIHHHFEKMGLHETTVVMRFWIVCFILCVIGMFSTI